MDEIKKYYRPDKSEQLLHKGLTVGKFLASMVSPLFPPCEIITNILDNCVKKEEENFIESVLKNEKIIDQNSLEIFERFDRLRKTMLVIWKVKTEEKKKHFFNLTINGLLQKDNITDDKYDIFVQILDELSDIEFNMLMAICEIEDAHKNQKYDPKISIDAERELLTKLDMSREDFLAFVSRLKGKGLIVPLTFSVSNDDKTFGDSDEVMPLCISNGGNVYGDIEEFYINAVDGHVSKLFKNLLCFINS